MASEASSDPAKTPAPELPEATARNLQVMLGQIWKKNEATILERVEALRTAHWQLQTGPMNSECERQALAAAHKLAGVLGTFGLARGSELARAAEAILQQNSPDQAPALGSILDELLPLIQSKSLELQQSS